MNLFQCKSKWFIECSDSHFMDFVVFFFYFVSLMSLVACYVCCFSNHLGVIDVVVVGISCGGYCGCSCLGLDRSSMNVQSKARNIRKLISGFHVSWKTPWSYDKFTYYTCLLFMLSFFWWHCGRCFWPHLLTCFLLYGVLLPTWTDEVLKFTAFAPEEWWKKQSFFFWRGVPSKSPVWCISRQ